MKNPILIIMKKELARFFGDKKLLATILLPGVIIYILYTVMGSAMGSMLAPEETEPPRAAVYALPDSLSALSDGSAGLRFVPFDGRDAVKESVIAGESDVGIVFPPDFDEAVAAYDVTSAGEEHAPNVEVYYNNGSVDSTNAYSLVTALLNSYEETLSNKFDINAVYDTDEYPYDVGDESAFLGDIFGMMMPMLLVTFLFSGCMAVAPESIAGEKERGTLYTILVTPVKRTHLAIGKIAALAIVALLSGAASFIGIMLALPKLMGGAMGESMTVSLYRVGDYVSIALVIFSTVLLITTLISLISASAKSVKEAQTMVTPLMIVVILAAVLSMFQSGDASTGFYLIPLYNSILSLFSVFSFAASPLPIVLTVVSNVVYSAVGVFVLARMFASEKVMF